MREQIARRTERLRQHLAEGSTPPVSLLEAYKAPEFKSVLSAETHDKCAYCESKITHTYPGDVEHIAPKVSNALRRFEHANLTLACWRCNHNKDTYYDPTLPLVDPFVDHPEQELVALGPMVWHRTFRGKATVLTIDLNRAPLMERRTERLESICRLVDVIRGTPDGPDRRLLEVELCRELREDKEYVFVSRSYVESELGLRCA